METITINQIEVARFLIWAETEGQGNWGGWSDYPVAGRYLSFDTCHIRFEPHKPADFGGFKYVTSGRNCPGNGSSISIYSLKELVSQDDLDSAKEEVRIKLIRKEVDYLQKQLNHSERCLNEYDPYRPMICWDSAFEQVFIKSEKREESYISRLGIIHIGNTKLEFDEPVLFKFTRTQGKNGPNKKRVFRPESIPSYVEYDMNTTLKAETEKRIAYLKDDILRCKQKIKELLNP